MLQFLKKKKTEETKCIYKFTCISVDILWKSIWEVGNITIKEGDWGRVGGKLFTKCLFEIMKFENVVLKKEVLTEHCI